MLLTQVSPHCWYLPHQALTDRPALGYIRGDAHGVGVDAGNSPAHARLMAEALTQAALPHPDSIALTHSHWDHTFGLCAMQVPSYANARTQAHLEQMTHWEWTLPAMLERLRTREDIAFCHDHMMLEYPDVTQIKVCPATHICDDGQFDLGGVTVRMLQWSNSHADDCSVLYVPEDGVIFLGDICYSDLHHEPECWHRKRLLSLMDKLEACDFTLGILGHHAPMSKPDLLARLRGRLCDDETLILDD